MLKKIASTKKILLTTFVVSLFVAVSYSQQPVYKHYTAENGLPHDITYQIIQDKQGHIWIGTDDGLTKFNGSEFTNYTYENGLHSNFVIDIFEENSNKYLLATWGAGIHQLKNDSIKLIPQENNKVTKVRNVYKLNDSIIFGDFSNSLYLYNTKRNWKKTAIIIEDSILKKPKISFKKASRQSKSYSFSETFLNNKLFLFASGNRNTPKTIKPLKGIFVFDGYSLKKNKYSKLNSREVHSITISSNYLFAASHNHVFVFNEKKSLVSQKKIPIKNEIIIQLKVINQKLYFVSKNYKDGTQKIYMYDWDNNLLTNLSQKLAINSLISDFLFDSGKNLWITTYGQGVYFLPRTTNTFFGKEVFINPDLKDITNTNNNLIVLATNMIYEFTNNHITSKKVVPTHAEALQINKRKRKITIISSLFNPNQKHLGTNNISYKHSKCFNFNIDSTLIELKGNLFSSTKRGINTKTVINKIHDSYIRTASLYNNSIIALYGKGGIINITPPFKNEITSWNRINKKFTNGIFSDLFIQKDTAWVASNMGLFKVTPKKTIRFTTKQGLLSNHINDIHIDSHGVLWVATQKGLNVFKNNLFLSIEKELGQQSTFVTKITEQNNHIYVTGNRGLFKLNNIKPFSSQCNTKLLVKQNKSSFYLNTINYINPKSITLAYQLNNNSWIKTSSNNLDFKNTKQGKYNIKFRFKDNLSNWKYSKPYQFKIIYPWHQQTWFYVTITVLLLGAIVLLLIYVLQKSIKKNKKLNKNIEEKEKLQKALKEVRKNVARDFHDELGNKLASISITSNLLTDINYKNDKETQEKKLKQIKKDADYLYHGMKDFVWALDHKNDDLQQLQVYLNDFGESLFENSTIRFYSNHNLSNQKIELPFYWSKQLVLIFKEAMTNSLKHSNATKVFLTFNIQKNILKIMLEDNGKSFNINKLKRINGIQNMKFRAESLNQKIHLYTKNGVKIIFTGTLNNLKNE